MAVDHGLRQSELAAAQDAGLLELKRGDHGHVAGQEHVERFGVHERGVLDGVEAGPERVLDALVGAAVAGDLAVVVVRLVDDGRHLVEGHAERVVVGTVGRGGVAGRVGLDPLDAVLDELADRGAALDRAVDQQDQTFHAELQMVGVPVHQAAGAADLAAVGGQPWPGEEVFLDRLLEPDVDVVQAPAAPRRGVAALQREPGIGRGQQGDVFDGILDIQVGELGDVEIRRVKMRLDQAGQDRPPARVDPRGFGRDLRRPLTGPA